MGTDLLRDKPLSALIKFMVPLWIGNVFQQLYNMADTIIVGRYVGQNALAAVGSTGTIMFLVLGFSQGLTTGFTVLTSQSYGAHDDDGVKRSFANGILLAILCTIVLTIVSACSMQGVLTLMNTPAEIYDDAYTYIWIICVGLASSVFYNLFSAFLRAVGNSKAPLIFLVLSACMNVVLDLVLIINFNMGVAGAAIATVTSQGVSALLCLVYICKKVSFLIPRRDQWRLYEYATKHQMRVGLPMALQFGITASGTMIMQAAVNMFGATAVAAYTAAGKFQNVITQEMISMGQTMASYAGQNYGAGKLDRIKKGVHTAVLVEVVYALLAGVLSVTFVEPAMGLFFSAGTNLSEMMPYARTYILLCAIFYIPLSMIFIFRNTMQGCGYGMLPMLGGVVELFCRLGMAAASMHTMIYFLAAFCDPFAWLGAGIFTSVAYRIVIKRVEQTLSKEPLVEEAAGNVQ